VGFALSADRVRPDARPDHNSSCAGATGVAAKLSGVTEAWVYLLRCRDGSLYTGWTVDLERRLARHRTGSASRYTASRLPVDLELAIPMPDRSAARREEARIKRLSRADKLELVRTARAAA
jgi:putative endonuclease